MKLYSTHGVSSQTSADSFWVQNPVWQFLHIFRVYPFSLKKERRYSSSNIISAIENIIYKSCSLKRCRFCINYYSLFERKIFKTKTGTQIIYLKNPLLALMFTKREEGIAGFFEDIPVLIVVTIATGIFLVSIVSAYVNYLDHIEDQNMHDNATDFSNAIRSYEGLIYEYEEGVFEGDKLISLDERTLKEDFNESVLGYQYQVAIIDTSDYSNSNNYTTSFGNLNPPVKENKYTVTTSVLIKVEENFHAAQMIVTIWG